MATHVSSAKTTPKHGAVRTDWSPLERNNEKTHKHMGRRGEPHQLDTALHSSLLMNFMLAAMIVAFTALVLFWFAIEAPGGTTDSLMGSLMGTY